MLNILQMLYSFFWSFTFFHLCSLHAQIAAPASGRRGSKLSSAKIPSLLRFQTCWTQGHRFLTSQETNSLFSQTMSSWRIILLTCKQYLFPSATLTGYKSLLSEVWQTWLSWIWVKIISSSSQDMHFLLFLSLGRHYYNFLKVWCKNYI